MHIPPLLTDVVIIFSLAIVVLFVCHRLRLPAVVGFLFTGIFVGPFGVRLIKDMHEVEILAEIGVVLLLFTIGIEFSLEKLLKIRKPVLIGGPLQVIITFTASYFIAREFGQPVNNSIFIGFLVALSSTAIVIKLFQDKAEIDTPQGSTALGVLIFQDIIVVPMILITPLLGGASGSVGESLLILLGKAAAIILLVIISIKYIVPKLLYQIARTRNNELFLLSVVVLCFGVAWLTSLAGLSLALGAFLAGLIISESEYSHHALGNILPFRDVFTTFFFISIGMLLDVRFLIENVVIISAIVLGAILLKSFVAGFATLLIGYSLRTAILAGLALAQIGEFSFILSRVGSEHGIFGDVINQGFLAVAVLTMALTPFIMALGPRLADLVLKLPLPSKLVSGMSPAPPNLAEKLEDHLVIIGYGIIGRNVARAACLAGVPYIIIEMNPDTVRSERAKGEPIFYGDATYESVLHITHIEKARVVVVAINDPTATRRITSSVRRANPACHMIVRSRYLQEMAPLHKLGANEVIPEEYETAVEIFARVLTKYLISKDEIEKFVNEIRADEYEMFRSLSRPEPATTDTELHLHDIDISAFRVEEGSSLSNKTLAEINFRRLYGVTIVAIRRNWEVLSNPGADSRIYSNDVLFMLGAPEKITEAITMCTTLVENKNNIGEKTK